MKTNALHRGAQIVLGMIVLAFAALALASCDSPRTNDTVVPLNTTDGKFAINVWGSDLAKADKTKTQSLTTAPVRDTAINEAILVGGGLAGSYLNSKLGTQIGGKTPLVVTPR